MRNFYSILFGKKVFLIGMVSICLLGAGQGNMADSTLKTKPRTDRIVQTEAMNTQIGEKLMRVNAAENIESKVYMQIDSSKISKPE